MPTRNEYYKDLRFEYDLFLEMPQIRSEPLTCITSLFLHQSKSPETKKLIELAQIDAFWMLHLFRWGSIDGLSAERLLNAGLLTKYATKIIFTSEYYKISETGWETVFASLSDKRVSERLFPFITDLALLPESDCLLYSMQMTREYYERGLHNPSLI